MVPPVLSWSNTQGALKRTPPSGKRTPSISELARKRFIDKWPRERLVEHFSRSKNTITWWTVQLKQRDFRFKAIPPGLQKELRKAALADTGGSNDKRN
jgi:hypothetical protein